jgi:hypothetical protein
MQVSCTITYDKDDAAPMKTADELAADVLTACGGTPEGDLCYVTLVVPPGQVGNPPGPPTGLERSSP